MIENSGRAEGYDPTPSRKTPRALAGAVQPKTGRNGTAGQVSGTPRGRTKAAKAFIRDTVGDNPLTRDEALEQQRDLRALRASLLADHAACRQRGDDGRARRLGRTIRDIDDELAYVRDWLREDKAQRQDLTARKNRILVCAMDEVLPLDMHQAVLKRAAELGGAA